MPSRAENPSPALIPPVRVAADRSFILGCDDGGGASRRLGARDETRPPASPLTTDRVRDRGCGLLLTATAAVGVVAVSGKHDDPPKTLPRHKPRTERPRHGRRQPACPPPRSRRSPVGWIPLPCTSRSPARPCKGSSRSGATRRATTTARDRCRRHPKCPGSTRGTPCARCPRTRARPRTGAATAGPASPRCSSATAARGSCSARTTAPCTSSTA